jgi:hypothetical protein
MIKIADLLDRDFSDPIEEKVRVNDSEPDIVLGELSEYVATDRIRAEYERLFSAMVAAAKKPQGFFGVWISGVCGTGKSHFAKNLGYVLADREVLGTPASSLFVKQVESEPVTEAVALLNRLAPCEIFLLDGDCAKGGDTLSARALIDLCEMRRPGKTCAFILDGMDEHFGSLRREVERLKAGKIPEPVWMVVTAREEPPSALKNLFEHRIDLPAADIREIAARRVLRKQSSRVAILRELFHDHGARFLQNVKLERSSRRTDFDEDQFVQFYPYLPHLIDLSMDIADGILRDPNAPRLSGGGNYTLVKQCFEMLASDRTRMGDQPVGALVSIDKIYALLEGSLPPEKQHDTFVIGVRCEDQSNPGLAGRVAKAICLMELAKTDLPRTTKNIAALLVERFTDPPATLAIASLLKRMKTAHFVSETEDGWTLYEHDFDGLREAADALEGLKNAVGAVNPRPPGRHNDLIQLVKKWRVGALAWYTRPLRAFNASVSRSIEEIVGALDPLIDLPTDVVVLQERLAQAEKKSTSLQEQIDLLRAQVAALGRDQKAADSPFFIITGGGDERTAYVVGLFGTGRQYVCGLMRQNLGERARYFRDTIRLHAGPTPMIYSGHATLKYVSRAQHLPAVTSRVMEAVKAGFADLIFVYRHPLDSLLTNWVWWRTYIQESRCISGISQVYRNAADLCADLERNFGEFQAFAAGDPAFFDAVRGPRFLSFAEFVEETGLYLQSAATLTLRLEDFAIDPRKEFLKIVGVMGVDIDLNEVRVDSPRSKPYGYRFVQDNVPPFRSFIEALRPVTKRRMQRLGYEL